MRRRNPLNTGSMDRQLAGQETEPLPQETRAADDSDDDESDHNRSHLDAGYGERPVEI